jgi:hypothetical protein
MGVSVVIEALAKELVPELKEAVGELFTLQGEGGDAAGMAEPEVGFKEQVELYAEGMFAELADKKDQAAEAELSVTGKIGVGTPQPAKHGRISAADVKEGF